MRRVHRKNKPRVIDGKAQFKNNWSLTQHWAQTEIEGLVFARERPGHGYRHYVRQRDLERFVRLLPDWEELSTGLDAVLLAAGAGDRQGYCSPGIVALGAWSKDLVEDWNAEFVQAHRPVLDRLDVECTELDADTFRMRFTEASVQGFQLMHVLLHEFGHHHDRMTTRAKQHTGRGEAYAEAYALRHAEALWDAYHREFAW